eukprot:2925020-Prymnesium_polylepis.1
MCVGAPVSDTGCCPFVSQCRLEQWARMTSSGLDDMFVYGSAARETRDSPALREERQESGKHHSGQGQLVPLRQTSWYLNSIFVFEGDFTVEADKHKLVSAVLGLWALVTHSSDETTHLEIFTLVMGNIDRVFPPELFGDLLARYAEMTRSSLGVGTSLEKISSRILSARKTRQRNGSVLAHGQTSSYASGEFAPNAQWHKYAKGLEIAEKPVGGRFRIALAKVCIVCRRGASDGAAEGDEAAEGSDTVSEMRQGASKRRSKEDSALLRRLGDRLSHIAEQRKPTSTEPLLVLQA